MKLHYNIAMLNDEVIGEDDLASYVYFMVDIINKVITRKSYGIDVIDLDGNQAFIWKNLRISFTQDRTCS